MKSKYNEIFKELVKAYHSNTLESTLDIILQIYDVNKIELCNILSSMCGIKLSYTDNYISDFKNALSSYSGKEKIVDKVISCNIECNPTEKIGFCQRSCPFDAIVNDGKSTYIDTLKCTDCGICINACPNGKYLDKIQYLPLVDILKSDVPVIAAVAPAIVGQFGTAATLEHLRAAFIQLGFKDMVEVAFFADLLTLKEAVEFNEHIHSKDDLVITSCCCPMWVAMIKRLYSDLSKYVTPSISPMIAAGKIIKHLSPDHKVVFIGPCVAKKAEAKTPDISGNIDFVLTFEELKNIFDALNIIPSKLIPVPSKEYASMCGRIYGYTGGVSKAVGEIVRNLYPDKYELYAPFQADGVKECKEILKDSLSNSSQYNFIEGMGCKGGCVGGPKAIIDKIDGELALKALGESSEIKIPTESIYTSDILSKLDIHSINDFMDKEKTEIFHREL